ncbi:monocarboxylate transporter 12-like [Brachionus plicatilis]|uniref:Monocarboxylate transporter 12-like n=1 Tax=Brachionus plicatilis TaxID=10195 RepID=A0A3M7T8U4_BRAPC|nr:monocarboxylate transporter 12-like [Brachionus plicatilis]
MIEPSKSPERMTKKVQIIENADNINIPKDKSSSSGSLSVKSAFNCNFSLVVLAASFFAYMLASLLSGCFGIFFENMETDLGWSRTKVAFIGGLISALQELTGPISSALTNEFGCRKTAVFGGLIASLGMIGSAYVDDFWLLGFLMGGVTGFGSSLVLVSSVVVVTYYFEEKPSFAAGLTISGGSLGQSIFSLIIIKLNEIYGRSGCFLILGGILLNIVVCALLFRPLKWELEEDDESESEDSESDDESQANSAHSPHVHEAKEMEEKSIYTEISKTPRVSKKMLKSANFINFKVEKNFGFMSESCLYERNKYLDIEDNYQASELSLKSNQILDQIRPVKKLMSCQADSSSLSRCHSLDFRNSRSETNALKPNSSVPTDLDSDLDDFEPEEQFLPHEKQDDEYVVVDADDFDNCGSNLILSGSQNTLYLSLYPEDKTLAKENTDKKLGSRPSIDKNSPQNTNKVISYLRNKFNRPKETGQCEMADQPKSITLNQAFIAKHGQKIANKKYFIAKCSCKNKANNLNSILDKPSHHLPHCPLHYIKVSATGQNNTVARSKNVYHVPNLFQNSYRFPIHFRNVYYYKSLLNLNMRIMVLRPHGAGALTVNAPTNAVSLSCPNLNKRQVVIIKNSNLNSSDHKAPVLTIKTSGKKLDKLENLNAVSGSKILNAGSIILFNPNKGNRRESGVIRKDEEEDESSSDESQSEDEDECDNCLTRTKYGNYSYKYLIKPVRRSLKFIYYTIAENLKLFKLFKFSIFAFCNFILSFFYESPFYFINSYMIENGSTQSQAGTITVAVGIVSVFSSIIYGFIGDSKKINPIILYSFSLILCGVCCWAIPFFIANYWITMVLMNLVGALISVSDVLVPIVCVNIVGYDDFVNAYGLMFFCQGLASFTGPPVLGVVVDYTGGYAISFHIIGIGICISGIVLLIILFYEKLEKKKQKDQKTGNSQNA